MGGRGGRRARGGTGQRLMSGILSTRLFELPTPLLVLPGVSSAQVSWRPNIFGGQDCIGPEGRSSSTPNVFGGYDTTFPDGSRSSSHPNVLRGRGHDDAQGHHRVEAQHLRRQGLPPREQRADRVTPEHLRRAGLQAAYTTSWSADRTFSAAKIAADSEGGQRLHLKGSSPSGSPSTCDLLDFSSRGSIGPPGDRAYAGPCSAGRERPP